MKKFIKLLKKISLITIIYSFNLTIAMNVAMQTDEEQIEYLKEHPELIDKIISGKKWFHTCCFPSKEITLAEQAKQELSRDKKIITYLDPEKLNQRIQNFKSYEFRWLSKAQIKEIKSQNFTPKIISFLNLANINNLSSIQINGLQLTQVQTLLKHYQTLVDIKDQKNFARIIAFLHKLKENTLSVLVRSEINSFEIKKIYSGVSDDTINNSVTLNKEELETKLLIHFDNIDLVYLIRHAQSNIIKKIALNLLNEDFLKNITNFPAEYMEYIVISKLIPTGIEKLEQDQIEALKPIQIESLNALQLITLLKVYKKSLNFKNINNYTKFIQFIDNIKNYIKSPNIIAAIHIFEVKEIYAELSDNIINNSTVLNKSELETKLFVHLDNTDLIYLIRYAQSKTVKEIALNLLNKNFFKNIANFPGEYMEYIIIPNLTSTGIEELEKEQIEALTEGQLASLRKEQIEAFKPEQIQFFKVKQIKKLIDLKFLQYLTKPQIQALTKDQLQSIDLDLELVFSPKQIHDFTPNQIKDFTNKQISNLDINLISKLPEEKIKTLSDEEINTIFEKMKDTLNIIHKPSFNKLIEANNLINKIKKTHAKNFALKKLISKFQVDTFLPNIKDENLASLPQDQVLYIKNNLIAKLSIQSLETLLKNTRSENIGIWAVLILSEKLLENSIKFKTLVETSKLSTNLINYLSQNELNAFIYSIENYPVNKLSKLGIERLSTINKFNYLLSITLYNKNLKTKKQRLTQPQRNYISNNIHFALINKFKSFSKDTLKHFIKNEKDPLLNSIAYEVYKEEN